MSNAGAWDFFGLPRRIGGGPQSECHEPKPTMHRAKKSDPGIVPTCGENKRGGSFGGFPVRKDWDREDSGEAMHRQDAESGVRVTGAEQIRRIIKRDQLGTTPSARRCASAAPLRAPENRRPGRLGIRLEPMYGVGLDG